MESCGYFVKGAKNVFDIINDGEHDQKNLKISKTEVRHESTLKFKSIN